MRRGTEAERKERKRLQGFRVSLVSKVTDLEVKQKLFFCFVLDLFFLLRVD